LLGRRERQESKHDRAAGQENEDESLYDHGFKQVRLQSRGAFRVVKKLAVSGRRRCR
jgi:hypothetical protein